MKTLADLKRRLTIGTVVTMVRHDWFPTSELLNRYRKVANTTTRAVMFGDKSWLEFPSAKEVRIDSQDRFSVLLERGSDSWMTYEIVTPETFDRPGFRLLKNGELIEEGDEWLWPDYRQHKDHKSDEFDWRGPEELSHNKVAVIRADNALIGKHYSIMDSPLQRAIVAD